MSCREIPKGEEMTAAFQTSELERFTNKAIGTMLAGRRAQLGLSQSQVAKMLGCHTVGISQIENGHRNATIRTMVRVAIALGCTLKVSLDPLPTKPKRKSRRKARAT